ncbi:hypothetical protein NQ318_021535 [Aromia moschata]|uniref:EDR1/CTR1/ARMC3-like peptidase-like domain-containing protein n=1 Tax=Aromia moschata TaxID=1265417 RepID=A0AAV8ZE26_9CUCU|nr:hypothetical protein NQ318_021535 [Aromia moschata]
MAKSKSSDKKSKATKLDTKKADDIKEKSYITKQVDTSIAILDSPENDVVLESLLFLSKYADIQLNNLNYLQQHGMMVKLLNLFNRNICILRLSLRLLSSLVLLEDVLFELDQDVYNDKIIEIADIEASSVMQKSTLELLYVLLNAPAALSTLPDIQNFDVSIIMMHLDNPNGKVSRLAFEIIRKLTYYGLEVFQKMFKENKLVEKMFEVILNPEKIEFHQSALAIIKNCMNCVETESYFIESLVFLEFCQWVKTCDQDYLMPCIDIFEKLSKIPSIKQTLFDLSIEDSILYFLRSTDKKVLNKTCEAISNMSTHKYCCERLLNPTVLRELTQILYREDEEDPGNEVALKTIFDFSRRNVKTLDLLVFIEAQNILLEYFTNGTAVVSEESFLRVLEILYKWSIHPVHQIYIISENFFEELLKIFVSSSDKVSTVACEILTNFVHCKEFKQVFLSKNGPQIFVGALSTTHGPKKFKNMLLFILANLINTDIVMAFLKSNLVTTLKQLPQTTKYKVPLIDKILLLTYNLHLPLKFFETNRLDITDKLENKFYLINGPWRTYFPFLEILEAQKGVTEVESLRSGSTIRSSMRSLSMTSWESSESVNQSPFDINYGTLSSDPFLPKYIHHVNKFLKGDVTIADKIRIIGEYVDALLCGPKEEYTINQKIHAFKLHIESLKERLGVNMIPIGFLRIGFHCERALLFKAIADKCCVPVSLVKGEEQTLYVVDLMKHVGTLLEVGSKEANEYCNLSK